MNYIILSSNDKNHWGWCSNLGHELFFTRKITLILLSNNKINKDVTIVTSSNDRKFLYTNIFKNVITYSEFKKISHTSTDNIIDLCPYLLSLNAASKDFLNDIGAPDGKTIQCLKNLDLNENMLIENKIFQNCNTKELVNLCCKFQYINLEKTEFSKIINTNFCVIHIKPTTTYLDYLLELIDKLSIKCIIFTQKDDIDKKYLQTSDLQIYASLLNNKNCISFLTEWSGGGQLSQFCCKNKIIYYFDSYPQTYFNEQEYEYRNINNSDFYNLWDHYTPINCKRIFLTKQEFKNLDNLINLIN